MSVLYPGQRVICINTTPPRCPPTKSFLHLLTIGATYTIREIIPANLIHNDPRPSGGVTLEEIPLPYKCCFGAWHFSPKDLPEELRAALRARGPSALPRVLEPSQ